MVIFITYFHTKFHILNPSCSLVIANKLKTKENVHTATRLLLYIPQQSTEYSIGVASIVKIRAAQKLNYGRSSWVTAMPSLLLFYLTSIVCNKLYKNLPTGSNVKKWTDATCSCRQYFDLTNQRILSL